MVKTLNGICPIKPDPFRRCNAGEAGSNPGKCRGQQNKKEGNKMMTLVIEHDNGKAGQRGFSDYQIGEKAEAQKIINEYEEKGIFIYSVNFCQI